MQLNPRRQALKFVFGSCALLLACGGGFDGPDLEGAEDGAWEEEYAEQDGTVLGTSWQALSYPTCSSASSDPDGDGWGWENFRSCIVSTGGQSGSTSGTSCSNHEGTASTMAAIAVSAAMELRRWQPTQDFTIGRIGGDEALILTAGAKARCFDGRCANTQSLLDFQKNEANGQVQFPGNVSLNSGALRSRLVAKFRDQVACENQPSNGGTTNCPVEEHSLTFQRSEKGGCDTNYFFVARKPDGQPLQYPAQLKNKLQWADKLNPYIGFQSVGEVVSIDPTYGLNEAGSTTTGACSGACTRLASSSIAGQCCSCNGVSRKYVKAPWSAMVYLCQ
jgi:hypothetical protein